MAYRTAVALALALATTSGLAAQSYNSTTSTTEDKTTATGAAKTNDSMEGKQIASNGLQVVGTVISSDANRLTVKADNGQQMTFIVNESTTDPKLFNVGDRVTASYVTLAGTGPVVTKVVSTPMSARTSTGTVTYSEPAATATTTVTPPSAKVAVTPPSATVAVTPPVATTTVTNDTVAEVDVDNDADNDGIADADEALPATASPLALIALAGFAASGAARAVRRFRK